MSNEIPPVIQALGEAVSAEFPGGLLAITTFRGNHRFHVCPKHAYGVLKYLRARAGFGMLIDLSAADYLQYPDLEDRYGIWYCLLDVDNGRRLIVKTTANDPDPKVESVVDLWEGANWMEREVYDMYGIEFLHHPDLRRILLPDEFVGYPLRRDYPMRGKGERHNFPVLTRAEG